ncbi:hypothetical protein KIH79_04810, partial [Bifidobacterium sp. 82T10]|nr:hypothetical protein [Bifidobacterium miconis]
MSAIRSRCTGKPGRGASSITPRSASLSESSAALDAAPDAVAINGTPTLLCTATVSDWAERPNPLAQTDEDGFRRTGGADGDIASGAASNAADDSDNDADLGVIELAPLPGFPVQRDLIADIDPM